MSVWGRATYPGNNSATDNVDAPGEPGRRVVSLLVPMPRFDTPRSSMVEQPRHDAAPRLRSFNTVDLSRREVCCNGLDAGSSPAGVIWFRSIKE